MTQGSNRKPRLLRRPTPAFSSSTSTENGQDVVVLPQEDTETNRQEHEATSQDVHNEASLQKEVAPERQSDADLNKQGVASVELSGDTALPNYNSNTASSESASEITQQNTATWVRHDAEETVPQGTETLLEQNVAMASIHRDDAISRYRDEEKGQQTATTIQRQEGIPSEQLHATTVEKSSDEVLPLQSGSTPEQRSGATIAAQSNKVVVPQSTDHLEQRNDGTMIEQRKVTEALQTNSEVLIEEDEAAALESMLATVPGEAVAQLMQALLVQPKVNKLNAAAWRSGGMQVTHGTHKSYKLLAGQYGVHMRDIVEQTLKACLPIWRARLKQLREEGVLGEEEAEEELDD